MVKNSSRGANLVILGPKWLKMSHFGDLWPDLFWPGPGLGWFLMVILVISSLDGQKWSILIIFDHLVKRVGFGQAYSFQARPGFGWGLMVFLIIFDHFGQIWSK